VAVDLIVESEGDISASQIKRTIGVSYKTAWHLRNRIRDALAAADTRLFMHLIEAAGTFRGETEGDERGYRDGVAADAQDYRTGEWHVQRENGMRGTNGKTEKNREKGGGANAKGDTSSADNVWSFSNRSIGGLHEISDEHMNVLLNALSSYFDRQETPHTFRDAIRKLLTAGKLPHKE
jgi:hypothetical protein